MPDHESWFSWAFPSLFRNIEALTVWFNHGITGEDGTWIAHEHYGHGGANVQHVVGALFVLFLLTVLSLWVRGQIADTKAAIVPEEKLTWRTFVELFTGTVYKMMSDIMGKDAARFFLPLIGACAFFIFVSNALGLIPGFIPPTESLKTTVACAVVIFFATHIFGISRNGMNHVKHLFGPWLGPLGIPLNLLMLVIEIISHIARPISLSLRLMANIFADHLVVAIFATLVPFLLPVPVMLLGTMVVVVQTLVFCLLSTVYIAMAIEQHDHGESDEHGDGHHTDGAPHGHAPADV
jgi:F-type H+-transporting ATPase subunit a